MRRAEGEISPQPKEISPLPTRVGRDPQVGLLNRFYEPLARVLSDPDRFRL